MDMPEEIKSYKVIFVGNTAVGKTHLFNRQWLYLNNKRIVWRRLPKVIQPSIGVEYAQKNYQLSNNQTVNLLYWDTSGQKRYRQIVSYHQKEAKGVYLVYDITKRSTFDELENWLNDIKSQADKDAVMILIGNKLDKVADNNQPREVSLEEAQIFAEIHKLIFMEVSTYSNEDIEKCQTRMVEEICNGKLKDSQ
ncbi:unnamed protein product [Paramecium octaurelia]|uniref:Uncharacterized protein n=1 Tax=Paramecium octaurelia TaxID=43137 RepID=A0A8S1XMP9_PAROT|nr:unnamed protein product [Paramecium octaurelia]